ncbi:MAG: MATE family efflux transporter, partial [Oscillospiraceae bacterium]|nr:MATE family efflux transporter [Oscillospiraceae bacterium]
LALTGIGLCFPLITLIMAFTALFGMGGLPRFSIARGAGDEDKAAKILGNSCALLLAASVVLTLLSYAFRRPVLFAFGASEASYVFADEYLKIYLAGTVFSMLASGLNGYISAQGFPGTGMLTVALGAILNIVLDPVFIFALDMGIAGAALATVISQIASALWLLHFLMGKNAIVALRLNNLRINAKITKNILRLGTSNFVMQGTNCLVQVACNSTLQRYGGDLYVGVMTVTSSVRELCSLPVHGIVNGAQPVISFNYGAGKPERVKSGIRFNALLGTGYTMVTWILILLFTRFWIDVFTDDALLIESGVQALRIYFFGFVFMALQFAGQTAFQALGDAKHAIFFSLLRKAIIVTPLTLLLPWLGFGVNGVFLAEPISNVIGGLACYLTMYFTLYRKLGREEK